MKNLKAIKNKGKMHPKKKELNKSSIYNLKDTDAINILSEVEIDSEFLIEKRTS